MEKEKTTKYRNYFKKKIYFEEKEYENYSYKKHKNICDDHEDGA